MTRRCCTHCGRRPHAPGHAWCRPCKNASWKIRRPMYSELPEWQRRRAIARAYAGVYVRIGKLKPQPCEKCGTTRLVQKHHEDYSKPLAVRWLCQPHHREEHAHAEAA
jgi:hypothetical protein